MTTVQEAERVLTFCRICPAFCGVVADVVPTDDGPRITRVMGDREHPLTQGYTCPKGRKMGALQRAPSRFLTSQRGDRSGGFSPIDTDRAVKETGERLRHIVDEHGADAVAVFVGTQAYMATLTWPTVRAWLDALGTRKYFRTMSIDQSAKIVTSGRLGYWMGGSQRFEESDVWLLVGSNPIVSMTGGPLTGIPVQEGRRGLRDARRRGLRLQVADPRRTETAAEADRHLQLRPGTDGLLIAAMLSVILREGLHDAEFCDAHTQGMGRLRRVIESVSPVSVAQEVGVPAAEIEAAAREFANAQSGMARTGTGPDMGPWSNLNEHLVQLLNVVCGRFPRAGALPGPSIDVIGGAERRAQVAGPHRPWETGYRSRLGFGLLEGDLPTASLPREITEPGTDRVRALLVVGGNPVAAIPDRNATVDAFKKLDFLVCLEPYPTETAGLADMVLAPALAIERPDSTRNFDGWYSERFAQYTPPVIPRPPGVREDWELLARISQAMNLTLDLGGLRLGPHDSLPSSDELLDQFPCHGGLSVEQMREHPHGHVYGGDEHSTVLTADETASRFDVLPDDILDELQRLLRRERIVVSSERPYLLAVRRARNAMNTLGPRVEGSAADPFNPCFAHPDLIAEIDATPGDVVEIESAFGRVRAVLDSDETLRSDVVTLTHGFGSIADGEADPRILGTNPGWLLSLAEDVETINGMPRMTGVPVSVRRRT